LLYHVLHALFIILLFNKKECNNRIQPVGSLLENFNQLLCCKISAGHRGRSRSI